MEYTDSEEEGDGNARLEVQQAEERGERPEWTQHELH